MTRWRFLTNAYVEALALRTMPVMVTSPIAGFVSEGATKPKVNNVRIESGVFFGDAMYVRERDGLAWARVES